MKSNRLSSTHLALLLVAVAAVLRMYGIDWGLPHVYEEAIPLSKARMMWKWGSPAGVDLNPHFFNYPSLVLYIHFIGQGLLYIGSRLFGEVGSTFDFQVLYVVNKTPFILVARLITAAFGIATVWVTYQVGRRVAGEVAGTTSAFFIAVNTYHMERCQMVEVDVPLLFFVMLTLLFIIRILEEPVRRNYLLAGVSMGLAVSSKYTGALLILPLAAAHLLAGRWSFGKGRNSGSRRSKVAGGGGSKSAGGSGDRAAGGGRGKAGRSARGKTSGNGRGRATGAMSKTSGGRGKGTTSRAATTGAAGKSKAAGAGTRPGRPVSYRPAWQLLFLALLLAIAVFCVTSPYVLLDIDTFRQHFALERQHMRLGHFGYDTTRSWLYYLKAFTDRILGWPLALVALAGLVYMVVTRWRTWGLVLASLLVPYFLAVGSWAMKADRYLLPVLPVVLLFAGGGLAQGFAYLEGMVTSRKLRALITVSVVLLVSIPLLASFPRYFERFRIDTRTMATRWIEANVPSGAFIVTEMYGPDFLAPPDLSLLDLKLRDAVIRKISGRPNYAVLPMPMFQVRPERSEVFYDLSLYRDADVIVTSSFIGSRYRREPERFERQMAFYDSLSAHFDLLREFIPQSQPGPILAVFKNPHYAVPFAGRKKAVGPRALRHTRGMATGSEELFYYNLGANYEAFGRFREAVKSYEFGFSYPIFRPVSYEKLVRGKTRSLIGMRKPKEAADFLQEAAAGAPTAQIRKIILDRRRDLLAHLQREGP
ncbi:MAG: glycosyltransferase family 39 protein [bacterium]|nr:MAG: glycosyltransferase family 39 protein [bacterium]